MTPTEVLKMLKSKIDAAGLNKCNYAIETSDIEAINQALLLYDVSKSLAPHRCPVCNGNGLAPNGFYMQTSGHWPTSSITPETCRSCGGTGIVWGYCWCG